jgi:4-hydroxymandelate oxidase
MDEPRPARQLLNVDDYEAAADDRMPQMGFDYYASGADDETTLYENRAAYAATPLHYRVLVDVSKREPSTSVLGSQLSMPIIIAPTAFHRLAHDEGELATVRAAGRSGTAMILSTLSTTPVEAVCAAATGPVWFQLYVYKDREATRGLVRRAEEAGCTALVLTVDAPVLGRREIDVRNGFHLPAGMRAANLLPVGMGKLTARAGDSGLAGYVSDLLDPSLNWSDLDWLASITDLPLLVKGIVRPDDACRAADHGAAGIVVSNHGGRQLDTAPATLHVLPRIVDALAGRPDLEVLMDGGIRRGSDVLKALAYGAKAVLVGRPVLYGLAVSGEDGVHHVLEILRSELDRTMALCGAPTVADITRDLVDPG